MDTTEFDEIRPYNDEELPQIFEELRYRTSPLNFWRRKYVPVRASWIFRKHSVMVFYGK